MFRSGQELIAYCENNNCTIAHAMLQRELDLYNLSEAAVRKRMLNQWQIMRASTEQALQKELKSMGGLIGGEAQKLQLRQQAGKSICGDVMARAMTYAMGVLEVNATMGLIVAAPTAGSSGIMPGVFRALQEDYRWSDQQMVDALLTASAIGLIIMEKATISGAEGGCQAETGSAAAMTAAAVCELFTADVTVCLDAAAICLKNVLGLVCDPIAGLVEAPCQKRNSIGAANALISAEMALSGIKSVIPFDEVVVAMGQVGRNLPAALRETGLGGVAATPTGLKIKIK